MLSPRLQAPTGLYQPFSRIFHRNSRPSFSTSAPRWPRISPRTSRPLRRKDVAAQELPHQELHQELDRVQSKLSRATSFAEVISARESERPAHGQADDVVPKETASSSTTIRQRSAPPGVKPYKQSLFICDIIRQGADRILITTPSQAEHQKIIAAGKFFQQGFKFLYSAEALRHHAKNDHMPEIVVLGASNVGKSSFLNALVGRPGAARVSARPGKTTLMNAYGVGPVPKIPKALVRKGEKPPQHSLIVVDTPGYGFKSQAGWGDTILKYIDARKTLRGAVVLLSSEKRLMEQDKWLLRELARSNTRTLVVLTKADKGGGSWTTTCSEMAQVLREELKALEKAAGSGWREGSGWNPYVYITSAGMDRVPQLGNGGGMGGVRAAILEMAGFSLENKEVKKKDETVTYGGPVVSFDDIKWKT